MAVPLARGNPVRLIIEHPRSRRQIDNLDGVTTFGYETEKIGRRNHSGRIVGQWMEVGDIGRHNFGVEHHLYFSCTVVYQGQRTDRAGHDAKPLTQPLGGAERKPRRANFTGQSLHVKWTFFESDYEPLGSLFVPEE